MNENSENIEWKHVYTIKEMTPIQGLEKGLLISNQDPLVEEVVISKTQD